MKTILYRDWRSFENERFREIWTKKNEENIIPLFLTFQEKLKYFFSLFLSTTFRQQKQKFSRINIIPTFCRPQKFLILEYVWLCRSFILSLYFVYFVSGILFLVGIKTVNWWIAVFFDCKPFFLSRKKILTHFRRKSRGGTWCSEWARNLYPTIIFPFLKDEKCRYFLFCEKCKTLERTSFLLFFGVFHKPLSLSVCKLN